MNTKEAQVWAADILISMGHSIPDIGRAMDNISKDKAVREYSRSIIDYVDRRGDERTIEMIDGCIVARKTAGGKVVFGISSIHENDIGMVIPKKVTGIVAAVQSYLAPEATIPSRFEYLFCNDAMRPDENPRFVARCFNYFKVSQIKLKIAEKKTGGCGYKAKVMAFKPLVAKTSTIKKTEFMNKLKSNVKDCLKKCTSTCTCK